MKLARGEKDFRLNKEEINQRLMWLAKCVYRTCCLSYRSMSSIMHDDRYNQTDISIFSEIIGYTMSFVFDKLLDEIEKYKKSENEDIEDLYIHYVLTLSECFDHEMGYEMKGSGIFETIFLDYNSPKYDSGYYEFWSLPFQPQKQGNEKTIGEILKDDEWLREHNAHLYYVYRMNKIVPISKKDKVLQNAVNRYQPIASHFYDDAFFNLSIKKIKTELDRMNRDRRYGIAAFQKLIDGDFMLEAVKMLRILYEAFLSETWAIMSSGSVQIDNPKRSKSELENLAFFITDLSIIIVSFASQKDKGREREVKLYEEMRTNWLHNPPVSREAAPSTVVSVKLYSKAAQMGVEAARSIGLVFANQANMSSTSLSKVIEMQFSKYLDSNGESISGLTRGFVYG